MPFSRPSLGAVKPFLEPLIPNLDPLLEIGVLPGGRKNPHPNQVGWGFFTGLKSYGTTTITLSATVAPDVIVTPSVSSAGLKPLAAGGVARTSYAPGSRNENR